MIRLKVKEICEERDISRNLLSHLAILDLKTIRRMFDKPTDSFSTYALDRIAYALNMDVKDLFDYERGDPPISAPRKPSGKKQSS